MLTPADVTAVIVTKGNVDLAPVLASVADFQEIIVWNNAANSLGRDLKTYGRVMAARRSMTEWVWSQDDDIVHTPEAHREILAAARDFTLTGCMWPEWSQGARDQGIEDGYDDLVFPGSGSISQVDLWDDCIAEYLAEFEEDDFFHLWCDTIIGVIAPTQQLDIRFEALPCADDPDRMANMPDAVALKTEAIRRARQIRDGVPA